MEYKIKNGFRIAERGFVIIENTQHYVLNGYVYCNEKLNERAWGVTEKKGICPICNKFNKPVQLELF